MTLLYFNIFYSSLLCYAISPRSIIFLFTLPPIFIPPPLIEEWVPSSSYFFIFSDQELHIRRFASAQQIFHPIFERLGSLRFLSCNRQLPVRDNKYIMS